MGWNGVSQEAGFYKSVRNKVVLFAIAIAVLLTLACGNKQIKEAENGENHTLGIENNTIYGTDERGLTYDGDDKQGDIIGNYQYPENPAEQLRSALDKDISANGLPLKIGTIETTELDRMEYLQMNIRFTDGSENECIISFFNKHLEYDWDQSLNGHDNPSFKIAMKDHTDAQGMVMILTSVIKYLSPDLSFMEAQRLAENQNKTIGTDGYSQPVDLGGYQVQARYTNPNLFFRTPDFETKLGVTVRAISQLWGSGMDVGLCQKLSVDNFSLLTSEHPWRYNEESDEPEIVYSDFIVEDVSEHQSYLHGETWRSVKAKSMVTGLVYRLTFDTWAFPNPYEFGIGQQYTLFVGRKYTSGVCGGIMYAVQRTESTEFNSRGFQTLDYFTHDYESPWSRVEPVEEGTVYNVFFTLKSQTWGEPFAAQEGHGIGEEQWPESPPGWEGYTFLGWYDNTEWKGEPYTKDTPIYEDTCLYARWKYTGPGGTLPRAHMGKIEGIEDGGTVSAGSEVTIAALGYNTTLEAPEDQRFRWIPVSWRLSNGVKGVFSDTGQYRAVLSAELKGEQTLSITYKEEIFDYSYWQPTGQQLEVEEIAFQVN